jgi:hypothetical protein
VRPGTCFDGASPHGRELHGSPSVDHSPGDEKAPIWREEKAKDAVKKAYDAAKDAA